MKMDKMMDWEMMGWKMDRMMGRKME